MRDIESATYKRYNANNRGNNSPDCVKRAISMAFDLDYNQVSKLLIAKAKKHHCTNWNIAPVFEDVIYELGGEKAKEPDRIYQVDDFIDAVFPTGTVILETGPKPCRYNAGNHLTCVVDGVLYDSWDSSDQYVAQYYVVEGVAHNFTDIQDHLEEMVPEGEKLILQLCSKYEEKYDLQGRIALQPTRIDGFTIKFQYLYQDDCTGSRLKDRYNYVNCVFSPTMSLQEARKKMIETIKIRLYDKFYAVAKAHVDKKEGNTLFEQSGYTEEHKKKWCMDIAYLPGNERRFFNSLPGWAKPFVTYMDIDRPGYYHDSYKLEILPIKGDPRKPSPDSIRSRDLVVFEAYDAATIREELQRYKQTFERPMDDYDPLEDY